MGKNFAIWNTKANWNSCEWYVYAVIRFFIIYASFACAPRIGVGKVLNSFLSLPVYLCVKSFVVTKRLYTNNMQKHTQMKFGITRYHICFCCYHHRSQLNCHTSVKHSSSPTKISNVFETICIVLREFSLALVPFWLQIFFSVCLFVWCAAFGFGFVSLHRSLCVSVWFNFFHFYFHFRFSIVVQFLHLSIYLMHEFSLRPFLSNPLESVSSVSNSIAFGCCDSFDSSIYAAFFCVLYSLPLILSLFVWSMNKSKITLLSVEWERILIEGREKKSEICRMHIQRPSFWTFAM